jgi:hypothetical protein
MIYQNPPHHLCCHAEEVRAVLPVDARLIYQPQNLCDGKLHPSDLPVKRRFSLGHFFQ